MIGKCKAIAHGSTALDYIFREGKLGYRLAFITPFSSVSVRELSNNESSAMINFQGNLYEQIQRKSCPMAAAG